MNASLLNAHHSPPLVLLCGLATFVSLVGVGTGLLRLFGIRLPSPWHVIAGALLGIQVNGLLVFAAGAGGFASKPVLISIWVALLAGGIPCAVLFARGLIPEGASPPRGWATLPVALAACGLVLGLLVAMAPSTRHDELFYHMLVPRRIVEDGALVVYRLPWQAAILFHLTYQMGQAPLHALGLPDAANVMSWCLALTEIWFFWFVLVRHTKSMTWAYLWAPALAVGMYPIVLGVCSGPHAMGDLAIMAAFVALAARTDVERDVPRRDYLVMMSLFALAMVSAKAIYVPLAVAMMAWALVVSLREEASRSRSIAAVAIASVPWLVFLAPVLAWTWWASGAPFGPLGAGLFGETVFSGWIAYAIESSRAFGRAGAAHVLKYLAMYHCPLVWAGLGMFMVPSLRSRERLDYDRATPSEPPNLPLGPADGEAGSRRSRRTVVTERLAAGGLVTLQAALVLFYLWHEARYLGGLPFGMALVFAIYVPESARQVARKPWPPLLVSLVVVPWLAVQGWYALQFVPVATGFESREAFCRGKVALYRDFEELGRALPPDAGLYFAGRADSAAYAPRPVYFHPADAPPGKRLFLMHMGDTEAPEGFSLGRTVYENPGAVLGAFRTPLRPTSIGALRVVELLPPGGGR